MLKNYLGNDLYEIYFDDGTTITISTSNIQSLCNESENYNNLDTEYNDLVEREKSILKSIEEALQFIREIGDDIEKVRRTTLKESLKSQLEDIEDTIGQWI